MMPARDRTAEFFRLAGYSQPPDPLPVSQSRANFYRAMNALADNSLPQARDVAVSESQQAQKENEYNEQAQLHWAEVERMLRQTRKKVVVAEPFTTALVPVATDEMRDIERRIARVSILYDAVNELVQRQSGLIDGVERAVDTIELRIDSARKELEDAAPRAYRAARRRTLCARLCPQTFNNRLRCGVFLVIVLHYCAFLIYAVVNEPSSTT